MVARELFQESPIETGRLYGGIGAEDFKSLFRDHPGGVAVITADAGGGPAALTATSVSSVSVDPPLLVFSVSDRSSASGTINTADHVVVHLLSSAQFALGKLCATSGADRFADDVPWERLPTGEPRYVEAEAWVRGEVVARVSAGSATIAVVHALDVGLPTRRANGDPLVYHAGNWHRLGQETVIRD